MKLSSPILLFTLASTGLHAGFVVYTKSNTITLPNSTGSVMVVKLENENLQQNIVEKKPLESKKQPPDNKPALLNNISVKNNHSIQRFKTENNTTPEKSKARVTSIIHKELNQHFTYPKLAVRSNWQGKVVLSLQVSSKGKITNIKLNNSSGYDILDRAAINSLSKVEKLPEISSWLPFDIDLEFPIIYKLIEG